MVSLIVWKNHRVAIFCWVNRLASSILIIWRTMLFVGVRGDVLEHLSERWSISLRISVFHGCLVSRLDLGVVQLQVLVAFSVLSVLGGDLSVFGGGLLRSSCRLGSSLGAVGCSI